MKKEGRREKAGRKEEGREEEGGRRKGERKEGAGFLISISISMSDYILFEEVLGRDG